ncbi:hypothetical protein DHD32_21030 [Arenibacter sp. TNZ]|uniref:carboxypeptidase regulatory-like domain-containing protein n=1 Tax=Arenibacter TaxID=178469 RepID=UPI000CD47546|nr:MULTISPECIES: carboxypeptidase regulatory-like domain-containing protein [Arenibacter]MCM4173958.1 hypothetical protein [Arenibacter sp. TNZ]
MKNNVILFIGLLCCFGANAQVVTLSGSVTDSLKTPLAYSTLIAKPADSDQSMQFTATNDQGKYTLELYKDLEYTISVSMLGFKTLDLAYTPLEDFEKNIVLIEDVTQLDAVTVVMELPISIKKDTIIYRTDKFVTGEERKLKDILEKLPGIEVDKDGTVTSQGKKVTHVLVENKSFFGGNSKLAVDNIPANAVHEVEIIDDYNEISFLKGMTQTDNMAMNIKLKKDKKNFVFGDIEAGKGNESFYKAHANLFYYHPELNINFIGGLNNNGEKTFTYKDYQNFMGGPSNVFNARDVAERKTISDAIEVTDVTKSENKVGALNITKALNDKIDLSSYLIFSGSKNENLVETTNDYILPDNSFLENVTNMGSIHKKLGLGKVKLTYVPNTLEQWSLDIMAKGTDNTDGASILSTIGTEEQSFKSVDNSEDTYVNGNMEWHKKLSTKHAFSSSGNFEYDNSGSNIFWDTNRAISEGIVPLEPDDIYRLELLRQIQNRTASGIFKHYWNIDNFNLLHTTFGNQYRAYRFVTNDSQLLDDGTVNDFGSNGFGNDLNFRLNDLYAGIYYNARVGKFEFHQSLFLHNYSWSIDQANVIKKNKWALLPDVSIRRRSSSTGSFLRLDSSLRSSFSDVAKLAGNYYLQSYNSVYIGNKDLENELRHYSSLTYSRLSLLRGLYTLGVISYEYRINGITSSIITEDQDRLTSPFRLSAPNQNLNGTVIAKKSTKNFKYSLTTRLNSSRSSRQINGTISEYKNTTGSYRLSAQTLHKKFPIIEVGFKQSIGNYGSNNKTFNFLTNEPFISFEYDFLKNFIGSFDYTHYNYQNRSTDLTNAFSIGNASLSYGKESSAWDFKVSVQNLFDVRSKNQNSFNVFVVSDQNTFVLPRIVMFSLIYKL